MEECKRMGLQVLGPDVNESYYKFSVNKENAIRFGMGAIRGVGKSAVQTIVGARKKDGPFASVFDMTKRIDLRAANKKAFENLVLAGGFDSFGTAHRAQYFHKMQDGLSFLEKVIRYGSKYQDGENSSQQSLFGEASEVQIPEPEIPPCEPWGSMETLRKEKEVVGIYISGHPLDEFKREISAFCNASVNTFQDPGQYINRELTVGGIITEVQHRVSKNGKGWGLFTLEDYTDSFEFRIFGEEYLKFRHFLLINSFVHIKVFIREGWTNRETGKKGEPRFQFIQFAQLQDVLEQYARKLTIQLDLNEVKPEKVDTLKNLLSPHKGKHPLHFSIYENRDAMKINLNSRRKKVQISRELLASLEEHNVPYKLN